MIIALDAMGGDHAPGELVQGALDSVRDLGVEIVLVGDEAVVRRELAARSGGRPPAAITVQHASEVIGYDEAPVQAIRRKKDSSLAVALRLVKEGKADACVSAGSTGALLAGGLFIVGRLPAVSRPALGTIVPTRKGVSLLLDVGANVDNRPEHLLQFAVMGSIYAQRVLKIASPTVALLNIGTEESKGNEVTKAAYGLLKNSGLNFVGNLEPRELPAGGVDIIVADGFVGNVVLKLYEGLASNLFGMIKEALTSTAVAKLGALLVKGSLGGLKKQFDYSEYGGAPLLGLQAPVIKCHGSSKARAIYNGVRVARDLAAGDAMGQLQAELTARSEIQTTE